MYIPAESYIRSRPTPAIPTQENNLHNFRISDGSTVSRNSGPSANRHIANPNTACASVGTDAVPYIELMCFRFFLSSAAARRNDDGRTPMRRQRLYSTSIDVNQPHNSTAGGFDLHGYVGDIFIRSANCLKLATAVLRTVIRTRCVLRLNAAWRQLHISSVVILFGTQRLKSLSGLKSVNVAKAVIPVSDKLKILGATLGSNLTMEPHTKTLCSSCFYDIRSLKQIRSSLADSVASSHFSSLLDYVNSILYRFQRIQHSLARVVTHRRSHAVASATALLKQLHWLPVEWCIGLYGLNSLL